MKTLPWLSAAAQNVAVTQESEVSGNAETRVPTDQVEPSKENALPASSVATQKAAVAQDTASSGAPPGGENEAQDWPSFVETNALPLSVTAMHEVGAEVQLMPVTVLPSGGLALDHEAPS
jgi:hypothetical protein